SIAVLFFSFLWFLFPFARLAAHLLAFCMLCLMFIDFNLIQPWFWFNFFLIWSLLPFAKYHHFYQKLWPFDKTLQLVVGAVYVWSALFKFQSEFQNFTFPFLMQPVTQIFWQYTENIHQMAFAVAGFELILGLLIIAGT